MNRTKPSWTRIAVASIGMAVFMTLVGALTHRYVSHRGWVWDEAIALGAIYLILVPLFGALARRHRPRGK